MYMLLQVLGSYVSTKYAAPYTWNLLRLEL